MKHILISSYLVLTRRVRSLIKITIKLKVLIPNDKSFRMFIFNSSCLFIKQKKQLS